MTEEYEGFTEFQRQLLTRYVTSLTSNIFALKNLPEVIKGALFSRYSRSSLGLRSLLLKEFILNEETAFSSITGDSEDPSENPEAQVIAVKKAQNFYDRILDGYGDDSIGELGGAHLAIENVSMIATKVIEDARIGGSPLEKSTRYIYFDQKVNGEYLFYQEPVLMTSAHRSLYMDTCTMLFDTYSKLAPVLTAILEQKYPREHETSKVAYTAALRAKVLDCLRGLLPASTLTNLGIYGNGRFFETLLQRCNRHDLSELQDIGKKAYQELSKIIPSFIRRSDLNHKHYKDYAAYHQKVTTELQQVADNIAKKVPSMNTLGVRLVHCDPSSAQRVAAALLFANSEASLHELQAACAKMSDKELSKILEPAAAFRGNRRHKSPRALEHATFTFEIIADYGIYRDLHRHRVLTQERQTLNCEYGYDIPREIQGSDMEAAFRAAMDAAKAAHDLIVKDFPEEAQYVVPMSYNIHWYFHVNLRSLQWLTELRSAAAGHPNYRFIAQEMAKQASKAIPLFERFFKFVDFEGYELGRLGQEIRLAEKMQARESHV